MYHKGDIVRVKSLENVCDAGGCISDAKVEVGTILKVSDYLLCCDSHNDIWFVYPDGSDEGWIPEHCVELIFSR